MNKLVMIEGSLNYEIENAAYRKQEKLPDNNIERQKSLFYKNQEKKAFGSALNANTEKRDETENEEEWPYEEDEIPIIGTKILKTKRHVGKRLTQVLGTLKSSITTSFKKRVLKRRHETIPTKNTTPVSDCTSMNCIINEYESGHDFCDIFTSSDKTWNSKTAAQKDETYFCGNEFEEDIDMKRTIRDDKHFYDSRVPQSIPVSKISINRGKERNANCHAAPYSAALGTMKSFHDDTNGCNNYRVEKHTVIPFWTPPMWKENTEQEVTVDATLNPMIEKYWEMKVVLPRNSSSLRAKESETVEIEDDNQINKPKYDNSGSESASANKQDHEVGKDIVQDCCSSSSNPLDLIGECETFRITDTTQRLLKENLQAEDEVFREGKNGRKEVLSVGDKVFTEEANRMKPNEKKQVLPVKIESHKKSLDKEIIVPQKEEKSFTLLPTKCQQMVQALQRRSETKLTQTISPAACTENLDSIQQDLKRGKMGYFLLANSVKKFENDFSTHPSFSFSSADLNEGGTLLFLLPLFHPSETSGKENLYLSEVWKTKLGLLFGNILNWLHATILTSSNTVQYHVNEQIDYQHEIKQMKTSYFLPIFLSELSPHIQMFQNPHSGFVKSKSEAAEEMKIDLFNTEKKQHQIFSFIVVDLIGRVSIFPTLSLFSIVDSFVSSEKDNIILGEVWKALLELVLQNLLIWPHWRMVKTSDTSQTDWLTKSYGETRSFVYNYKFSCLLFVQFRLTLSHWQNVVKKNVLFVNPLIMTEEILLPRKNANRNIYPKISTISLTLLHNDDLDPCQRIPFQSRLQTTVLQYDANKKSEENAMWKPPVLQEMEKKVDNSVVIKYERYYTHTNYGRQNEKDPNCKKFKKNSINENTRGKKTKRNVYTLLDFDVNKKKGENALSKAPVSQSIEKELDANRTCAVLLKNEDYYIDEKYGRQVSLKENTSAKISDRLKLCTVNKTNDDLETRAMWRPMENKSSYFIHSIATNKQVTASKLTCAELDSNIHQRDHVYCTGGSNDLPVERYDEESNPWKFVEPTPRLVKKTSAAVVNNLIYVADDKGVLCYDIQKDSWSAMNLSYQWNFVKGGQVKILALNETLYTIRNESVFKTAIYLLRPETGQMTSVKDVKDNTFFNNNFLAVPEKRPTAEEVLNKTQQFDFRFSILDPKKMKLRDSDLNEVDVITGTEKSGPFLKKHSVPTKGGRRSVVRERREVIAIKQVTASKLTWAELDPAPNIYPEETDVGVDVITGIETGGPFLKNMAVPFKDREEVRERREVRLDPHQGVIREPNIGGRAFNDNPPMNT